MLPLSAYADRWSVKPGERIKFMVSSRGDAPFTARVARVICADPNPRGPGYREIPMQCSANGRHPGREQTIQVGSWARVPALDLTRTHRGITAVATIWPTTPAKGRQGIVSWRGEGAALELAIDAEGGITVEIADASGTRRLATGKKLLERAWYDVWASFDPSSATLTVGQCPRILHPTFDDAGVERATVAPLATPLGRGRAMLAACFDDPEHDAPRHLFNGKLERPTIWSTILGEAETISVQSGPVPRAGAADLLACWDFAIGIPTLQVADIGPFGFHGEVVNLPSRGMTSSSWSGREFRWTDKPDEWAAIHFHDDEIGDVAWKPSLELEIPRDWKSGVYAMHLESEHGVDNVPFVVRPAAHQKKATIAFLQPTVTYHVYSQFVRPGRQAEIAERAAAWGAMAPAPDGHPEYGVSPYNYHSDGSGVSVASMARPMIDKRVKQIHLMDPDETGSGTYWWCCDSYVHDWLVRGGFNHDTVSDHDLHAEGASLLEPYNVVICGQHPEYYTQEMHDALQGFLARGGRLIYLGGNGFYWKTVFHKTAAYALEVRRAESGIRIWATEPGESYHAFDGTNGGLWRRLGRSSHALVGISFTSQAYYKGYPYHVTDDALNERVAFMRKGLDNELRPGVALGDRGFMGGGAAGHELDRIDMMLGTPPHALVVARAICSHDPGFQPVNEDRLVQTLPKPIDELIRADMTFFETPAGGAVFSVGSMTFVGSLPVENYNNLLTRLVTNVLRRFDDPTPFTPSAK